ncbi:MAG: type II toxin-antitoxin system Phd/YefM family antitoxin [Acidobacteriota bacterium]
MKNGLSRYLAYVRRGGRVTILRRDSPVAELIPVSATAEGGVSDERILTLEREGVLRRGSGKVPDELLRPPRGEPSGVLQALLDERARGR